MSKSKTINIEELSGESKKLFDVLNKESDLSVILIGTSFLDATLKSILSIKFRKGKTSEALLDSRGGEIGTFMARVKICYSLNLIGSDLLKDLQLISELRNEVAHHHLELDFSSEVIKQKCNDLSYVTNLKQGNSFEPLGLQEYMVGARNQFTLTVSLISQRLILIGMGIKTK